MPESLPTIQVYRHTTRVHSFEKDEIISVCGVHVPTEYKNVYQTLFNKLSMTDPRFELVDYALRYQGPKYCAVYQRQVQNFIEFTKNHTVIKLFGFEDKDFITKASTFNNILSIKSIDRTEASARLGLFFLLVHKGITDTDIKKNDNICEELNAINTVITKPRIIKRRRGTNQRAVPEGSRDHLIQKHENSNAKPLAPLPRREMRRNLEHLLGGRGSPFGGGPPHYTLRGEMGGQAHTSYVSK